MTIMILKIVAVAVILAAMLIIILGIGHLLIGSFNTDRDDINQLRHDVESKHDVVSGKNMFHDLVSGDRLHERAEATKKIRKG